jgi:pyruvate formate lyase activating enzyme
MRSRSEDPRTVGIAYTYNEPLMWYEFVRDTSRLAKQKGLQNVLVTNGFIQEEPLRDILPQIDAMNIDVKGFTDQYYRKICSGQLEPVLRTVEMSHKNGCHIEITTVIVPELNDSEEEIDALTTWVASIDRNIPVHFSRYFPNYKFNTPPTPPATLMKAREIARRRLNYVYLGNLWGATGSDTTCPKCGKVVIERSAMEVTSVSLDHGRCPSCGEEIRIRGEVFKPEGE